MATSRPKSGRRVYRIAGWSLVGMVILWLLISMIAVYSLTRRNRVRTAEPLPANIQFVVEDLRLTTADGEDIGAWYIPGQTRLPSVVLIHGNGGQRTARWPQAEMLHRAGYPVMLISCRAHGDSSGHVNDFGFSARHDVVAAVKWLNYREPQQPIVIWGASLGSAAAIFAASELKQSVCGYILECPYQDLETAVWNRLQNNLPPLLDSVTYAGMRLASEVLLSDIDHISPLNQDGVGSYTVMGFQGSRFPSRRLWVNGRLEREELQGSLSDLWYASDDDSSFVR